MTSIVGRLARFDRATWRASTAIRVASAVPLCLVLAVALALRWFGLNWDSGAMFHPDERFILMTVEGKIGLSWPIDLAALLDPKTSSLNPHFFAYGSFPLYVLKLAGHVLSLVQPAFANADLRLVGRAINALLDTGTVFLTFSVGLRIGGQRVGLVAAALVTFSAIHIQLAHFYAVDSMLVFFIMLTLLIGLAIAERPSAGRSVILGIVFGLALATKVSVAPLALAVAVAHLLAILGRSPEERGKVVEDAVSGLVLAGTAAALVFLVTEPFAVLDKETFVANVTEQSEMVRRVRDYPYTRQYINTPAFWYQISQLSLFGLGLPFGFAGWLGLLYGGIRGVFLQRKGELLLLSWAIPYLAVTGVFEVKFMRYMLPIVPLLAVFGAKLLVDATDGLARLPVTWRLKAKATGYVVTGFVVLATFLFGIAYLQVYARPHTGVAMARWINANVAPGALILKEHWEEGLPNIGGVRQAELNLYDPDDVNKLRSVTTLLSQADYVVFYSNRLYGTIPRLPARYPMTSQYYRLLFSGGLGYQLVHAEASYPSIFGIALMDDTFVRPGLPAPAELSPYLPSPRLNMGFADESYSVYDHPLVLLFKKVGSIDAGEYERVLGASLPGPGALPITQDGRPSAGLLLPPDLAAADAAGGTWSGIFDPDGFANRFPAIVWLVVVELFSLAALPIAFAACRRLPDRGLLLAKPLGLLLVAWLVWLAASVRVVPFERWSIALALLVVGLASALILRRRRSELLSDLKTRRWTIIAGELVFVAAFLAFFWIRTLNPDLWHPARGGEKPMDFAYLNAVIRSTYFPPYDPWFAGGYINYYYFGQVLVATLVKLTGILPEISFNLAVPTLFAMTFAAAFSTVFNLASWGRGEKPASALVAGFVGGLFVAVAGNLDGIAQIVDGLMRAGQPVLPSQLPIVTGLAQSLSGLSRVVSGAAQMPAFDFWRSSRMMPPQISITEFPFFTFLFADLHAHLIALPFSVLAIGLSLNVALRNRSWWALALLGLAVGALRPTNSWDFPTYFGLAVAAVVVSQFGRRPFAFLANVAFRVPLLYLTGYLAFLPFHQNYELFYNGVEVAKETTPLQQYLTVHGFFLFLVISLLAVELRRRYTGTKVWRLLTLSVKHWDRLPHVLALASRLGHRSISGWLIVAAASLATVVGLAYVGLPTPATILVLLAGTGLLVVRLLAIRDDDTPRDLFVWIAFGVALALGAAVDVITVQGDINRMNTVFKFYLQSWVLMALVAGYAFWRLAVVPAQSSSWLRSMWLGLATILFAMVLIYPVAATPVRVRDRFLPLPPSDDGLDYMKSAQYQDEKGTIDLKWDYEAIQWLRTNVEGSPVIIEGTAPLYRWGSRISVNTGLPTVLGWDWHQKQQRWGYQLMVDVRQAEVNGFFTNPDPKQAVAVLRKYDVRYVIVGSVERLYYPGQGLAKFARMVGDQLEVTYQNPGTIIYRVRT